MKQILRAENIHKSFGGVRALKDVNLDIFEGEILCLVGENGCGKSTLVKILSGVYTPDQGRIFLDGQTYNKLTPIEAIHHGIQVIFQDLSLFPHMSVADNISMSQMVSGGKFVVNESRNRALASEQLKRILVDLDLDAKVADLSIANRQIVAICRALSMNARILFMDEPTTALTRREIESLLNIALELKKQGVSIVFISHKLDEVFMIADRITVLRDAVKVGEYDPGELDEMKLAFLMTGREIINKRFYRGTAGERVLLRTKNLSRDGMYENIDFAIREGEVVGLIGALGSGRTEFALSLFGLNKPDSGVIEYDGISETPATPFKAIEKGLALVPEDRLNQGLFIDKDIKTNLSAAVVSRLAKKGIFLNFKKQADMSHDLVSKVGVNTKNIDIEVRKLSGGNQQKIVLGKWLTANPEVFILDAPTVGVDIGSKAEIYEIIHDVAETGCAILMLSDEINEVVANCSRICVFQAGRIAFEFDEDDIEADDFRDRLNEVLQKENIEDER